MPVTKTPNPIDRQVGQRVRSLRMSKGWSQSALAACLGVTFQQVQKYEQGSSRIAPSRLQVIATELQTPISFFFDKPKESILNGNGFDEKINTFLTSSEGVRIIRAFARLKPTLRRSLAAIAEHMTT
jgi:transcriptional regulator with XRE-family HTH domain